MAARVYTQYVNSANPATTLSGTITSGATSLTLVGTTKVPANPNFTILIDTEFFLVTAINTGTGVCTVVPGQEGSTQAGHTAGANVYHVLTAATIDGIRGDISNADTMANKPSATKSGILFFPTDSPQIYRDTGAAMKPWGPIYPLRDPADLAPTTWVNQTSSAISATIDTSKAEHVLKVPTGRGRSWAMRVKTAPATPYIITTMLVPVISPFQAATTFFGGLLFRESATSKFIVMSFVFNQGIISLGKWTSETAFSTNYQNGSSAIAISGMPYWLRIKNDNTNLTWWVSGDGQNWIQCDSRAKADFFTTAPDQVGFGLDNENAGNDEYLHLLSWDES